MLESKKATETVKKMKDLLIERLLEGNFSRVSSFIRNDMILESDYYIEDLVSGDQIVNKPSVFIGAHEIKNKSDFQIDYFLTTAIVSGVEVKLKDKRNMKENNDSFVLCVFSRDGVETTVIPVVTGEDSIVASRENCTTFFLKNEEGFVGSSKNPVRNPFLNRSKFSEKKIGKLLSEVGGEKFSIPKVNERSDYLEEKFKVKNKIKKSKFNW